MIPHPNGHTVYPYTTLFRSRATDACGNTAECRQTVTVEDHTPPTITCVPNKNVDWSGVWSFDPLTASVPCGRVTNNTVSIETIMFAHCGNTFYPPFSLCLTD